MAEGLEEKTLFEQYLAALHPVERDVYLEVVDWVESLKGYLRVVADCSPTPLHEDEAIEVNITLRIGRKQEAEPRPQAGTMAHWWRYDRLGKKPEQSPIVVNAGFGVGKRGND